MASTTVRFALALSSVLLTAVPAAAQQPLTWTTEPGLGRTAIAHLATAPFPHPTRAYKDDRVLLFVPEGFRQGATVDLVVHYHGHNGEILKSDRAHHYREQLARSRKNAVLVEPQGPLLAADSSGGKHEDALGLRRFVDDVLARLAREGVVPVGAREGTVLLSGHSGAYHVIARELDRGGVEIAEVHLHDALYGDLASFEAWARKPGKRLVSTYTRLGGTASNNATLLQRLTAAGIATATTDGDLALAQARAFVLGTSVVHNDVTHDRDRWAHMLEASRLGDLGAPRPELLFARRTTSGIELSWRRGRSSALRAWRVQAASGPSAPFANVADVAAQAKGTVLSAAFAGARLRVVAVDDLGRESEPSDTYSASGTTAQILVVDGFSRTSGRWTRGEHSFGALVAASVAASGRAADVASARAVRDLELPLDAYTTVIWLAGDQSTQDAALDREEQDALRAWLRKGGALVLSGSEVAFALASGQASPEDRTFLSKVLRSSFASDASASRTATGKGFFAGVAATFGGAQAPYAVPFPDVLAPGTGAQTVLAYGDGRPAAVASEGPLGGSATSGVLFVGFPVETCDTTATRDALVARLIAWAIDVNQRAGR